MILLREKYRKDGKGKMQISQGGVTRPSSQFERELLLVRQLQIILERLRLLGLVEYDDSDTSQLYIHTYVFGLIWPVFMTLFSL